MPTATKKNSARAKAHGPVVGSPAPARPLRLEYVQAKTLTPNPKNWRRHPPDQIDALRGLIADDRIGWADALTFNERTGHLIDGHGRLKTVDPDDYVPVLIGSWTPEAEQKLLLTLDPIAAMAETDFRAARDLIDQTDFDTDALADVGDRLLDELDEALADEAEASEPERAARGGSAASSTGAGSARGEKLRGQHLIIVECADEDDLRALADDLAEDGLETWPLQR